ncbi:hypothetical protein R6Q59_002692 [Mikania micrantha]
MIGSKATRTDLFFNDYVPDLNEESHVEYSYNTIDLNVEPHADIGYESQASYAQQSDYGFMYSDVVSEPTRSRGLKGARHDQRSRDQRGRCPFRRVETIVSQKRVIECDFRPEKEEKDLIYVGKLVDCNWGPFEALDFVNLVSSLLFQSAGFSFSFAISFDAFEAEKDLFWIRVFWLFSNTLVVKKFLLKPILFIGSG